MRLTAKTYTDVMSLPLFGELEKLTPKLPSLPASQKSEKTGSKESLSDQMGLLETTGENVEIVSAGAGLPRFVQPSEIFEVAERGGFEPPIGF